MTDGYDRRCAISGEKTLPILDAAHIRSYASGGEHEVSNGLLLRTDIHKLFDRGYVTITEERALRGFRAAQSGFRQRQALLRLARSGTFASSGWVRRTITGSAAMASGKHVSGVAV